MDWNTPEVLLIDADPAMLPAHIRRLLPGQCTVAIATDAASGLERVRSGHPGVILLAHSLPDAIGLDVYEEVRALDARVPIILMTTAKNANSAIEAMKRGAFNYVAKPIDPEMLRATVGEALEVARRMHGGDAQFERPDLGAGDSEMVGACPAMLEVYKAIGRVATPAVRLWLELERLRERGLTFTQAWLSRPVRR